MGAPHASFESSSSAHTEKVDQELEMTTTDIETEEKDLRAVEHLAESRQKIKKEIAKVIVG